MDFGGSWDRESGSTFTCGLGVVRLTGANKTVGGTIGTNWFHKLTIAAGASITATAHVETVDTLTIEAGGTLTVQSGMNVTTDGNAVNINGTMNLSGTSTWSAGNITIQVNSGGLLSAQGTDSSNRVTFTRKSPGDLYDVLNDGGIDFNYVNVYYTASADKANTGFQIRSPGVETMNFDNVAFDFTEELNGAAMMQYNTARTLVTTGITFDSSTYGPGNDFNVEARAGTIRFRAWGGNYGGEDKDNDNGGSALWALDLVKRAFDSGGTAISDTSTVPSGFTVKFLLYINNMGGATNDISIRDVLDASFVYQAGTLKTDNSVANCASTTCTVGEESSVFTAVDATAAKTDGVDGDVISISGSTIDAGNQNAANAQFDIAANKVLAVLFTVKIQ